MDNITHSLCGAALSQTGLNRFAPRATLTLVLGALLPDIDVMAFSQGSIGYLKYHRGVTHSLVGVLSGSLVLASLIYFINRHFFKENNSLSNFWKWLLLSLVGIGSHVLLDFTNPYGVQLFYPFDRRWYAWDLVNFIDPWILGFLILGLGIPFLSKMINQEIGAPSSQYNWGAVVSLLFILFYWGAKDFSHRNAIEELKQKSFETGSAQKLAAFPQGFNPFSWRGVVETESAIHLVELGSYMLPTPYSTQKKEVYFKILSSKILEAAQSGPQGQVYFGFARFPYARIEEGENDYRVIFSDLRFEPTEFSRNRFQFTCELARNLQIMKESFRFY
jgi:inner membrane protein